MEVNKEAYSTVVDMTRMIDKQDSSDIIEIKLNSIVIFQVLDFVRHSIKGRSVNLGSVVQPAGKNYTQGVSSLLSVGKYLSSIF